MRSSWSITPAAPAPGSHVPNTIPTSTRNDNGDRMNVRNDPRPAPGPESMCRRSSPSRSSWPESPRVRAGGLGKGGVGGVDVQAILAKSFELAGLVAKPREAASEPPTAGSPARAEPPTIDGEATAAPDSSEASDAPPAAEPSKPAPSKREPQARAADVSGDAGSLAGSGWEADGWEFVAGHASAPGPSLFGYASSGVGGDVGNKIRSAWRRMSLGQRPMLSYVRKLELNAAANILTSASFTVLVDGVPVDEVSAIGMDYAEADWTERADIDLAPFAGRTVTLSFEVAANSNVCIEVFAKAWLRGVTVRDAVAAPAC